MYFPHRITIFPCNQQQKKFSQNSQNACLQNACLQPASFKAKGLRVFFSRGFLKLGVATNRIELKYVKIKQIPKLFPGAVFHTLPVVYYRYWSCKPYRYEISIQS